MPSPTATSTGSAADFLPEHLSYKALRDAAAGCRGCDLYLHATQSVFGEGATQAHLMLVGEQPGDSEDREGDPFVGPAGALLQKALDEAGIARTDVYITNAVKHFKWEPRGKMRLHKTPGAREIKACRPWLEAELAVVKPVAVLALGATAAKGLLGPDFSITKSRGEWAGTMGNASVMATFHPSAGLRAPEPERRAEIYTFIVADLKKAAQLIEEKA